MATRRGRPTQAEAKKLDMAVREAAVKTFVEMGYAGASMEAIAKAAGITRRSLYSRYADKRALFAGVISWALARFVEEESVTEAHGDEPEDLEAALLAIGRAAVTRAVHPQNVRLKQIAMSEADLFPEFKISAECQSRLHGGIPCWSETQQPIAFGNAVTDPDASLKVLSPNPFGAANPHAFSALRIR